MAALKYSQNADGAGYLYRAAFCLVKNDKVSALFFLNKAFANIDKGKIKIIKQFVKNPEVLVNKSDNLYWAEKILDEYRKQLYLLENRSTNITT